MGASVSPGLRDRVVAALEPLGDLRCESMFGGYGVSLDGTLVVILFQERAWVRTDDAGRDALEARGMPRFRFFGMTSLERYVQLPGDVVDAPGELRGWARRGRDAP